MRRLLLMGMAACGLALAVSAAGRAQCGLEFQLSAAATVPAAAPAAVAKPKFRLRMPSDRVAWRLESLISSAINDYQMWDALTSTRIRSGKGLKEANLAGSMLGGAFSVVSMLPKKHGKGHRKASPEARK